MQVTAATVGMDGDWLPVAVADPAVVAFLQACHDFPSTVARAHIMSIEALEFRLQKLCSRLRNYHSMW